MILYDDILRDFQRDKVKYVLVGGMAFNLHGATRNTADLDILVEMSDENLKKIVTILKKRGYQVRQPVDPMGIANAKLRWEWIHKKNMKAFNFYKDKEMKEVDIIIYSPVSYETAAKKVIRMKMGSLVIPLISIDHLIKMKQKADRPVDRLDIADLKEIKRLKGKR